MIAPRSLHFVVMTSALISYYDPPFTSLLNYPRLYLISHIEVRNRLHRLPNPILTTGLTLQTNRAHVVFSP
jgi:hypothetical protein